jgi:hypothetical protein
VGGKCGRLCLTREHVCFAPLQPLLGSHGWAAARADVLRVRQLDGARGKRLQLHTKAFDALVVLRVPAAEVLEALEQLLPAGALEHGARADAEPAGADDDEAAEAGGAALCERR